MWYQRKVCNNRLDQLVVRVFTKTVDGGTRWYVHNSMTLLLEIFRKIWIRSISDIFVATSNFLNVVFATFDENRPRMYCSAVLEHRKLPNFSNNRPSLSAYPYIRLSLVYLYIFIRRNVQLILSFPDNTTFNTNRQRGQLPKPASPMAVWLYCLRSSETPISRTIAYSFLFIPTLSILLLILTQTSSEGGCRRQPAR